MKISIVHPSRNRPEQAFKTAMKWLLSTTTEVEYILSLDNDDVNLDDYLNKFSTIPGIRILTNSNRSAIEAINNAAKEFSHELLVVISDDFDCQKDWDSLLLNQLKDQEDFVVKTIDGTQDWIITLPIMDKKYYDRFGYVYNPKYLHMFCLAEDAQVFMGDYTFKDIKDIKVGDSVIGSEKKQSKGKSKLNYLTRTVVTKIHKKQDELFKITLESGKVLKSTLDHKWAIYDYNNQLDYGFPFIGTKLMKVIDVPDECPKGLEWERGWLAGMWDGEGCFEVITQSPKHNPLICQKIEETLNKFGFSFSIQETIQRGKFLQRTFTLTGGKDEYVKFYNWIKPFKINKKRADKRILTTRFGTKDKIVKIESLGIQEVYCVSTETKNFVADGYLSHNCDTEMSHVADLLERKILVPMLFAHNHYTTGRSPMDALNARNNNTWSQGEALYLEGVKTNFGLTDFKGKLQCGPSHYQWLNSKGWNQI